MIAICPTAAGAKILRSGSIGRASPHLTRKRMLVGNARADAERLHLAISSVKCNDDPTPTARKDPGHDSSFFFVVSRAVCCCVSIFVCEPPWLHARKQRRGGQQQDHDARDVESGDQGDA